MSTPVISRLALLATGAAIAVAVAVAVTSADDRPSPAEVRLVPNVVGLPASRAERDLDAAGIRWRWQNGVRCVRADDLVVAQTRAQERVPAKTVVALTPDSVRAAPGSGDC